MKKIIALTSRERKNIARAERTKPLVNTYNKHRFEYRKNVLVDIEMVLSSLFKDQNYHATSENAVLIVEMIMDSRKLLEMDAATEKANQTQFKAFIDNCERLFPILFPDNINRPNISGTTVKFSKTFKAYLEKIQKDQADLKEKFTDAKKADTEALDEKRLELEILGKLQCREIKETFITQVSPLLLTENIVGNEAALQERLQTSFLDIKEMCTEMVELEKLKLFFISHPVNEKTAKQFESLQRKQPPGFFGDLYSRTSEYLFPKEDVPTQDVVNMMQKMTTLAKPKKVSIAKRVKERLECMRAEITALQTIFETRSIETKTQEQSEAVAGKKKKAAVKVTTQTVEQIKKNIQIQRHRKHLIHLTPLLDKIIKNSHLNPLEKSVFTARFPSLFSLRHFATMYEGAHHKSKAPLLEQARKDFEPFMKLLSIVLTHYLPESAPLLSMINKQIADETTLISQLDNETHAEGITTLDIKFNEIAELKDALIQRKITEFMQQTSPEEAPLLTERELQERLNSPEHPNNFDDLFFLATKIVIAQTTKQVLFADFTENKTRTKEHIKIAETDGARLQQERPAIADEDRVKVLVILSGLLAETDDPDVIRATLETQVERIKAEFSDIKLAINEQWYEGFHETLHTTFEWAEYLLSYINIYASLTNQAILPVIDLLPARDMQKDILGNISSIVLGAVFCYYLGAPDLKVLAAIVGPQLFIKSLSSYISSFQQVQDIGEKLESLPKYAQTLIEFTINMTSETTNLAILALAPFTANWMSPSRGQFAQILLISGLASFISKQIEAKLAKESRSEESHGRKTVFGMGIQLILTKIMGLLPDLSTHISAENLEWLQEAMYDLPQKETMAYYTNGLSERFESGYKHIEEICAQFDELLQLQGQGKSAVRKATRPFKLELHPDKAGPRYKAIAMAAEENYEALLKRTFTQENSVTSYELGQAMTEAAKAADAALPTVIAEKFEQLLKCRDAAEKTYILSDLYQALKSMPRDFVETMGSYSQLVILMHLIPRALKMCIESEV